MRLRAPPWVRWILVAATTALTTAWLVWRLGWSGRGVSPLMFWPVVVAEAYAVVRLALLVLRSSPGRPRPDEAGPAAADGAPSSVDVCIYVTAPQLRDVELAAGSARRVRVDRVIVALPDGPVGAENRRTLQERGVRVVGCDGTRADALAALVAESGAEAIAFMSDRMVATATLWDRARPLLADPGTGWVSSRAGVPEYRRREQVVHDEIIGPCLDRHDAVSWVANGSVIRRRALAERSDLAQLLVQRDEAVTVALHADGWGGRWMTTPIVVPHRHASAAWEARASRRGIADRLRLAHTRRNPLIARGLRPGDRIATAGRQVDDLGGSAFALVCAVVLAGLITNRLPLVWDRDLWLRLGLPAIALGSLTRWVCTDGLLVPGSLIRSNAHHLSTSVGGLVRSLVPARPRELITMTSVDPEGVSILSAAAPQIVVAVVLQAAVIYRAALSKSHLPLTVHIDLFYLVLAIGLLVALYVDLGLVVRGRQRLTYRPTPFERAAAMGDLVCQVTSVAPEVITVTATRPPLANERLLEIRDRRLEFPIPVGVIGIRHRRRSVVVELRPENLRTSRHDQLLRVWAEGFVAEADARTLAVDTGRMHDSLGDGSMRPAPLAARAVAAAALVLTGVILVPPYGAALASDAACLPLGPVVGSFSEFVHHGAPPTARAGDPTIDVDVDAEFAALRRQSIRWAHLRATPATRVGFRSGTRGVLDLEGMDPSVNVFSVPALDLNRATQLHLKVPDGSSTLVNVSWGSQRLIDLERGGRGLDAVFLYDSSTGAFVADQPPASSVEAPSDAYRATRRRILWNLPPPLDRTSRLRTGPASIPGTILAPTTEMSFGRPGDGLEQSGTVNGSLVVDRITSDSLGSVTGSLSPLGCYPRSEREESALATSTTARSVPVVPTTTGPATTVPTTTGPTTTVPSTTVPSVGTTGGAGGAQRSDSANGDDPTGSATTPTTDQPDHLAFTGARLADVATGAVAMIVAGLVLIPISRRLRDRRGAGGIALSPGGPAARGRPRPRS